MSVPFIKIDLKIMILHKTATLCKFGCHFEFLTKDGRQKNENHIFL